MPLLTPDMMRRKKRRHIYNPKDFNARFIKNASFNNYINDVFKEQIVQNKIKTKKNLTHDYNEFMIRLSEKEKTQSKRKIMYFIQHNLPKEISIGNSRHLTHKIQELKQKGYLGLFYQIPKFEVK